MLVNMLPGLREVRAPLSAGFLWLVVIWVLIEPNVPGPDSATGALASLYRASDVLSELGIGIALSFIAYLLGSLSTTVFSPLQRRLFPPPWPLSSTPLADSPRIPLSVQARGALRQIARSSQEHIASSLALSISQIDHFLEAQTGLRPSQFGTWPRHQGKDSPDRTKIRRRDRPIGPGFARPVDFRQRREALLASVVLSDLNIVATTRLLGRDQELYSSVDRLRAEVDFRLAVIPPLLVTAVSLGIRSDPHIIALLVLPGVFLAVALFIDAVRSERAANETLLDAIADQRVKSPTLERLEKQAAALASQSRREMMHAAAEEAALTLEDIAGALEYAFKSEPSLAKDAQRQVDVARVQVDRVRQLFPKTVAQAAEEALELFSEVAEAWLGVINGHSGHQDIEPEQHIERAKAHLIKFQSQVRMEEEGADASGSEPEEGGAP